MCRYRPATLSVVRFLVMVLASIPAFQPCLAHEMVPIPLGEDVLPIVTPGPHTSNSPDPIDFGEVTVFGTGTVEVQLINLTRHSLEATLGTAASEVTVSPPAVSLAPAGMPGSTASVLVQYAPTAPGTLGGDLVIVSTHASVRADRTETVPILGAAVAEPGHTGRSPGALDFGQVVLGSSSQRTLRVTNTTPHPLAVSLISGSQAVQVSPSLFSLAPSGAAGAFVDVAATYLPVQRGSLSSAITVSSTHDGHTLLEPVSMTGAALAPANLVLRDTTTGAEVTAIDLGSQTAGADWKPIQRYELVNTGDLPVSQDVSLGNMSKVIIGGDLPCSQDGGQGFCISVSGLSTPTQGLQGLGPGASLPVTFLFRGPEASDFSWSFSVDYDGGRSLSLTASGEVIPYLIAESALPGIGAPGAAVKAANDGDYTIDIMGPRLARGYGVDRLFHNIDDLDSVNLLNGNLTISLPLGNQQVVSPSLSYAFTLVYNSNVWDRWSKNFQDTQVFAPFPGATAGAGWSLHLGRLCEPTHWGVFYQLSQAEKDKVRCRGNYWSYTSPDGRQHELRGSSPNRDGSFDLDRAQMAQAPYLYARDGSYARLKRVNAAKRELELPDGTIHTFQTGSWADGWDDWRLTEMKDRYGHVVTVQYTTTASGIRWTLSDCQSTANPCPSSDLRVTTVELQRLNNQFFDFRVSSVEVPGFAGARRKYVLRYADATVARPWQGNFNPGGTFTVPRLTDVELPDHTAQSPSKYAMQYYLSGGTNGNRALRISQLTTPTMGRIQWDYDLVSSPLGGPCYDQRADADDVTRFLGVTSRKVLYEGGGTPATETFYRYADYDGDVISAGYCEWDGNVLTPPAPTPRAEHVTAVVMPTERNGSGTATRHKVTLNYFSVFPVTIRGAVPVPGGGWTGSEFGLPFTRNASRTEAGETLYLSTQLYDVGTVDLAQLPRNLVAGASPVRSRYVRYQLAPKSNCDDAEACPPDNARVVATLDVFHDDGDKWRLARNLNPDGLGHFRRTEVRASAGWDSRVQTVWKNWNPDAGTLFSSFTSVTDVTLPDEWILGTSADAFVQVGTAQRRATDECWETAGDEVRLKRARKRAGASPGTHDLIVQYTYDPEGRIEREEFFGGDLQTVPANLDLCAGALGTPAYGKSHSFSVVTRSDGKRVERRRSQIDGVNYFESDVDLDLLTGLAVASRDVGGRETTFGYDGLDRVRDRVPHSGAVERLDYQVGSTTKVTFTAHVPGNPAAVLRQGEVIYDDLGRVSVERERMPGGTWSKSRLDYDPAGRVISMTTTQPDDATWSSAHRYAYRYDVLGRPVELSKPDGSVVTMSYQGERQTSFTTSVGTGFQPGGANGTVTQSAETSTRILDPFGRVTSVATPAHTTTFTYDSANRAIAASRGAQTRSYGWDGRGLMLSESHPETGTVTYSQFDALGNSHRRSDGHATLGFEIDAAGRPFKVTEESAGGRLLKRLFYYASGHGKGQISKAIRYQYLETVDLGGLDDLAGQWSVAEDYTYGADGRVSARTLTVTQPGGAEPAKFDQTWTYTELGHVRQLGYPRCLNPGSGNCNLPRRTVTHSYGYGRLTAVTTAGGMGASLSYHANGMVASVAHDDGSTSDYGVAAHYMPRVASANLGGFNLGQYGYDGSGNLIALGPHRYTYDANGRLKQHYQSGTLEDWYGYTNHDVLSSVNGATLGVRNSDNRLSGETYTGAGHQKTDSTACASLEWDALGSLRSYRRTAGCGDPAAVYAMLYTADGSRVLVGGSNGFQWELRDDGGKLLSVFGGSGSSLATAKEWFYTGETAISSRESSGTVSHLHADHLSTPRGITRGGTLLRRSHSPFGVPLDSSQGEALDFAGHLRDPNGDSLHMQARTYLPEAGRFFSPDPARTGWNLYGYSSNAPLHRRDPDGRDDLVTRAQELAQDIVASGDKRPVLVMGNDMTNKVRPFTEHLRSELKSYGIKVMNWDDINPGNKGETFMQLVKGQFRFEEALRSSRFNKSVAVAHLRGKPGAFVLSESRYARAGGKVLKYGKKALRVLGLVGTAFVAKEAGAKVLDGDVGGAAYVVYDSSLLGLIGDVHSSFIEGTAGLAVAFTTLDREREVVTDADGNVISYRCNSCPPEWQMDESGRPPG